MVADRFPGLGIFQQAASAAQFVADKTREAVTVAKELATKAIAELRDRGLWPPHEEAPDVDRSDWMSSVLISGTDAGRCFDIF